jgi:hypothetical protein
VPCAATPTASAAENNVPKMMFRFIHTLLGICICDDGVQATDQ